MEAGIHTTKEKALSLNLNESIYGTLAEIGAGQEVASNFFKAGGASGTIAKTMSAYDMKFSDAIYGATKRYVCEEKLLKMLDKEYHLLSKRLNHRADETRFFAFANTVETINYQKTNEGHGWVGVRFQLTPFAEPNDCIIHVVLKDPDMIWQQEVLGKIGVNLIYGCFNHFADPEQLMISIGDNFSKDRIEIDMFRLEGPAFDGIDNRLMSLKLVKHGLTKAAIFNQHGIVKQPTSFLYKKNVCVLRGRFRPVTHVNVDMMIAGVRQFKKELDNKNESFDVIAELTLRDLTLGGEIDEQDFLDRVDLLNSLGQTVLISNYQEHYRLAVYLSRITKKGKIAFILGTNNLSHLFEEEYYTNLPGGIMEAFGKLFAANQQVFVYPSLSPDTKEVRTSQNFEAADHLKHLYQHLVTNHFIQDVKNAKVENLHIISDDVLAMIKKGEAGWEEFVPFKVAHMIKEKKMFKYKDLAAKV
ncbi:TonB-dependent receptor [Reichenbachiella carrageenanivorans]|uniref:TonB-dependent receptor n=1 Tax=Reichenbachiella carrageenanivorans TaxID=2979869 RepID=A0ABY6CY22_9BACT|nr:TonB-dependent receptor [Reichenbachiella carrageenanivorans]UXX78822.1 TonB-dependent receptor [Reichenbachiella carrageenanivorans]